MTHRWVTLVLVWWVRCLVVMPSSIAILWAWGGKAWDASHVDIFILCGMIIILSYDLFLDSQVAFVTKYLVDGFIIVDESLYHIWLDLYYNIGQKVKVEGYSSILDSWCLISPRHDHMSFKILIVSFIQIVWTIICNVNGFSFMIFHIFNKLWFK